jgi:hypothetical protein
MRPDPNEARVGHKSDPVPPAGVRVRVASPTPPATTTTLRAFLVRRRRAPRPVRRARRWPQVPRSHPLRLPYDCSQQLTPEDFARVEQLLIGTLRTLGGWRWTMGYPTRGEITRALRLVSAAHDPEQAHIRRCGAQIALMCDGISIPQTQPLVLRELPVTSDQIDAIQCLHRPGHGGLRPRQADHATARRAVCGSSLETRSPTTRSSDVPYPIARDPSCEPSRIGTSQSSRCPGERLPSRSTTERPRTTTSPWRSDGRSAPRKSSS